MPLRLRQQLPAYSPLALKPIATALASRIFAGSQEMERARSVVATEFDAEAVILTDSGRSALQLAIGLALARQPATRRIVALPAFQCYEVASAAVGAGCGVALYDVDPGTLSPVMQSVDVALRAGAGAIVVAPLYGIPVDWDAIATLAQRHDATAIEDAAQCSGAECQGQRLGSLGALSVLSFGRGKGWTGGGGGALCLRGPFADEQAGLARQLSPMATGREVRQVASTVIQWMAGRPALYGIPASIPALALGETRYHPPTLPTSAGVFSAALLRRMLELSRHEAVQRRANADRWRAKLAERAAVPAVPRDCIAGYIRFPVLVRNAKQLLASPDARRVGIAPSYPKPLAALPAIRERLRSQTISLPGAERLAGELVTLPTHSGVTPPDFQRALALIGQAT